MEEEFDDEQMSGEDSFSDEEMDSDQIQIEPRELQQALLDEEKNRTPLEDIKEFWNSSQPQIKKPQEGVSLYTTYIYLLRRMGASVDELKQVFLQGQELLKDLFDEWDLDSTYRRNFAFFLYTKAKQPAEALKIWRDILDSGWDSDQYAWIEVIRLERLFGDVENARDLLYKGINKKFESDPYDFFQYFLQFEREEGTREQVDIALQKINAVSSRLQNKQQRKKKDQPEKPANKKDGGRKRKAETEAPESNRFKKAVKVSDEPSKNGNSSNSATPKALVKDSEGFAIPSLPSKPTKQKSSEPKSDAPAASSTSSTTKEAEKPQGTERTIFLSNIPFGWTADDIRKIFPAAIDFRIPHRMKGKNKGFAFVDFESVDQANEALQLNGKLQVEGRDIQVFPNTHHESSEKPEFRYAKGEERTKLFVRNVDFKTTADQLREFFGEYGKVKDVRIVHHKNGKPKGVAYIEYFDEKSAQNGLAANQKFFNGRQIEVHISNPNLGKNPNSNGRASNADTAPVLGGGKRNVGFSLLTPRILLKK